MIDFQNHINRFCAEHDLTVALSYEMPIGYETAFGTYDVTVNTLFINRARIKDAPAYEALYYLYHELRHAEQYLHPERFDEAIRKSLHYVVLYNGVCYKLTGNTWYTCTLAGKEDYFTAAYLNLPYEIDANLFAYDQVKALLGEQSELQKLHAFWMPKTPFASAEYDSLFARIDERACN